MNRNELTEKFRANHMAFVNYINSLSDEEFLFKPEGKWTAGQQLAHIVASVKPLAQILAAKPLIASKFGKIDRATWSYDEVLANYLDKLAQGGKAPQQFDPEQISLDQKEALSKETLEHTENVIQNLNNYTDEELDSLVLPHPLLGKLTIREMLYMMTYHATHHQKGTAENLEQKP